MIDYKKHCLFGLFLWLDKGWQRIGFTVGNLASSGLFHCFDVEEFLYVCNIESNSSTRIYSLWIFVWKKILSRVTINRYLIDLYNIKWAMDVIPAVKHIHARREQQRHRVTRANWPPTTTLVCYAVQFALAARWFLSGHVKIHQKRIYTPSNITPASSTSITRIFLDYIGAVMHLLLISFVFLSARIYYRMTLCAIFATMISMRSVSFGRARIIFPGCNVSKLIRFFSDEIPS